MVYLYVSISWCDTYIVPHSNHSHYIPKSDLSASELAHQASPEGGRISTVQRSLRSELKQVGVMGMSQSETPQILQQL